MSHFNMDEFPTLGEPNPQKKSLQEKSVRVIVAKKDSRYQEYLEEMDTKFHKECFICGLKGDIPRGEWSYHVFLHDKGLCEGCCSRTPRIEILKRYICETKPEQCHQWMESHGGSMHELNVVSEWVIRGAHLWPHEYTDDVKQADIFHERWESIHYWSIWVREKRFRGEKVAWYSTRQKKIVVGTVNKVKEDRCQVYRDPESEEEKKLGNFFQKDIKTCRLLPPLSQEDALKLMRKTPGMRRPIEVSPFKCCGPCDRVRISLRAQEDSMNVGWSGPNKSPYGGLYCKDCYDSEEIHEKDWNMQRARQYYSDREHRGFGGVYVDNWRGKPGRTFRTCSCPSCSCPSPGNPHLKQVYVCEDCGKKGNGCQGWFDRRSATGGLRSPWDEQDHWFCRDCWCRDYWVKGEWTHDSNGSVWFKSS